ncbi:MAG: MMPL family transporter [Candidatus Poseidoniaceae archaeon]|jgi:predicted RND superfamily exporter protein|nr:MMPL family transporter [Candidatus Poseidoniaceae archaeon]
MTDEYESESDNDEPLQNRLSVILGHGQHKLTSRVKEFNARKALDAVLEAPQMFQREWQKYGATGVLTKFPIAMILIFLMMSSFFAYHSGFVDGTALKPGDEPSLKVNGDLEVYLPDGSPVKKTIQTVEENWSTNVMIIYIESPIEPIDDRRILQEMSYVESKLNPRLSDPTDDVIYALSLSTVVKEVNSSAPRVREAVIEEAAKSLCPPDDDQCITAQAGQWINDMSSNLDPLIGTYDIPGQERIDIIVDEMYEDDGTPSPGLDKLARDTDGDGLLDRAVIIIAVQETKERTAKEIIEDTSILLEEIKNEERQCDFDDQVNETCTWEDFQLTFTLTGPVPITNAVTEFSFKLFWQIFPLAIVLVAGGLFIFHSDVLQTGSWRPIQGIKVVIIAGLPTLCSVFWTLGILGWTNYEVTMTVIIVGPILLALGVSYGLHITNRYAEESGTKDEKIRQSMASTGRAVFLSAVTTVIGFISLTFTPMKPIETVGIALSGGIIIVYILTMAMVPNLTLILDLRKPKHPPLRIFEKAVQIPIKWSKGVIAFFLVLMFVSGYWGQANVVEDIDLLGMAPEDETSVITMKKYSREFNAGQVGMILVHGDISGDAPLEEAEPVEKLLGISALENNLNDINKTTAVSIVFLMKSVGVGLNASGEPIFAVINQPWFPEPLRDALEPYVNRTFTEDVTFWEVLTEPRATGTENPTIERFLLNVFYASLTDETRGLFISDDYSRNLVYVDMPFVPVAETTLAVSEVNQDTSMDYEGDIHAEELTGVAAVAIAVNELIVGSQWSSLGFAVILTLMTLAIVFKDVRFSFWTTAPVIATVALQWLVMWQMDVPLSLVTVMIGSILVGVGVDFSIHIANRIRELGGGLEAIRTSTVSTGMSLFEAATVTTLGLVTAYQIPIPEIQPFITVIIILLWIAAASALILLPAIFVALEEFGIGSTGGGSAMARKLGLGQVGDRGDIDMVDAVLIPDRGDAW